MTSRHDLNADYGEERVTKYAEYAVGDIVMANDLSCVPGTTDVKKKYRITAVGWNPYTHNFVYQMAIVQHFCNVPEFSLTRGDKSDD